MAVINTNLLALKGQNQLQRSHSSMQTSMERLSSGLRVNSAKDDAAGQAIANRMHANLRANDAVSRGINDGISLMQTAEGGLDSINEILQRSRELAVQAANGTLSDSDRASINAEYKELRAEIDRIAMGTEVFGKYPLAPAEVADSPDTPEPVTVESLADKFGVSGTTLTSQPSGLQFVSFIPKGATDVTITVNGLPGAEDDIQIFAMDGSHLVGTPVNGDTDATWKGNGVNSSSDLEKLFFESTSDILDSAEYSDDELLHYVPSEGEEFDESYKVVENVRGMTISYTGDGDHFGSDTDTGSGGETNNGSTDAKHMYERVNIDEVTETLFIAVTGMGVYNVSAEWASMPGEGGGTPMEPPVSKGLDIVTSATFGKKLDKETIPPAPSDHVSLGLEDVELDPIEKALEAMAKLQEAMSQVDGYRGTYGALTNRFESAIEGLAAQTVNTAAAQSRIMDADYAQEASAMVKAQILQQAGTAMLTQANQSPQTALQLLSG